MRDVCSVETVKVDNHVRDLMVLTVPRLVLDEQMSLVEPDKLLPEDGLARRFAKDFLHDETPVMLIRTEVYDLMCLICPGVRSIDEDLVESEAFHCPEDGLEQAWIVEIYPAEIAVETAEEVIEATAVCEEIVDSVEVFETISEASVVREFEVDETTCACFGEFIASVDSYIAQPDWTVISSVSCCIAEVEEVGFASYELLDDEFDSPIMGFETYSIPTWVDGFVNGTETVEIAAPVINVTEPDWNLVSSVVCCSAEVEEVGFASYELLDDESESTVMGFETYSIPTWVDGFVNGAETVVITDTEVDWNLVSSAVCCSAEVEDVEYVSYEVLDECIAAEGASDAFVTPEWVVELVSIREPVVDEFEIVDYDSYVVETIDSDITEMSEPEEFFTEEELTTMIEEIAGEYMPVVCFSFGPEVPVEKDWVLSFSF